MYVCLLSPRFCWFLQQSFFIVICFFFAVENGWNLCICRCLAFGVSLHCGRSFGQSQKHHINDADERRIHTDTHKNPNAMAFFSLFCTSSKWLLFFFATVVFVCDDITVVRALCIVNRISLVMKLNNKFQFSMLAMYIG